MKFINYLPDKLEYSYDELSKSLKLKFYDKDSGCYECEYFSVVKNGEWIKDTKRFGEDNYHCSVCGAVLEEDDVKWRNNYFCYHCGADMRKVGDAE